MKILKEATQKNVCLDKNYYTKLDIKYMLIHGECFWIDFTKELDNGFFSSDVDIIDDYDKFNEVEMRISTSYIKEIKVICEDGEYKVVAIGNNDKKYYVNL